MTPPTTLNMTTQASLVQTPLPHKRPKPPATHSLLAHAKNLLHLAKKTLHHKRQKPSPTNPPLPKHYSPKPKSPLLANPKNPPLPTHHFPKPTHHSQHDSPSTTLNMTAHPSLVQTPLPHKRPKPPATHSLLPLAKNLLSKAKNPPHHKPPQPSTTHPRHKPPAHNRQKPPATHSSLSKANPPLST